jgi:hypothetical protein
MGLGLGFQAFSKIFEGYMYVMIVNKEELEHLKKSLQKL